MTAPRLAALLVLATTVWLPPAPGPHGALPSVVHPFRAPARTYGAGHRGVDLALAAGAPVRAPAGGVVTFRGEVAGRGVVVLRHDDGLRSTLEPVDSSLSPGDHVTRGDVVGTLEAAGSHCAPSACLHWGVRLTDGSYVDPWSLLVPAHAVLLPD